MSETVSRALYIQTQGSTLAHSGGRFVVRKSSQTLFELPFVDVDLIFVFGAVQITTQTLGLCLEKEIPICLFSQKGKYYGVLRPPAKSNWALRRRQYALYEDENARLLFARRVVSAKIRNSRAFIMQRLRNRPDDDERVGLLLSRLKHYEKEVASVDSLASLLGVEGSAAREYFELLGRCVFPESFQFTKRSKRPPTDPINSMLSFGYSLVLYRIDSCMAARGLDSTIGLMHESRGYPALAYDLLEEFRAPIIDALVLKCVNEGIVSPHDFYYGEESPPACYLQDDCRARFLRAFERKLDDERTLPGVERKVDWRKTIDVQVARLCQYINGDFDAYAPLEIR